MIQQKHKDSVLPTKSCFAFAFVSASLLTLELLELFNNSKFICPRGKVKEGSICFEGRHIVIIRGNLFFNFQGVHNGLYINL